MLRGELHLSLIDEAEENKLPQLAAKFFTIEKDALHTTYISSQITAILDLGY